MDQKDNKKTCMACSCPCEAHKEHNHPVGEKPEEAKTCSTCGQERKQDRMCDYGCK
ncbi:MAG: hypothetical protein HYV25_01000 [Candidatus Harrisonbacteria bacterium]|nr:hypothetical protein [Candidatus Harrisonbacteria bacterium]